MFWCGILCRLRRNAGVRHVYPERCRSGSMRKDSFFSSSRLCSHLPRAFKGGFPGVPKKLPLKTVPALASRATPVCNSGPCYTYQYTHTDTQTQTRRHKQTSNQTQTHTHTNTQSHTQSHPRAHTHTETHRDTQRNTETHRDTQRHTATHSDTQRHTATHRHTQHTQHRPFTETMPCRKPRAWVNESTQHHTYLQR